jgi:hypothetical protein
MTWVLVVVLAVGTAVFKLLGPVIAGGKQPPPAMVRVIDLLTPALLTALVVTSTVSTGRDLVLDARAAGVALGLVLLLLRVPLVVALLAAALAVAGLRLLV